MYYKIVTYNEINKLNLIFLTYHPVQISGWADHSSNSYEWLKRLAPFTNPMVLFKDGAAVKDVLQVIGKYYLAPNFSYINHLFSFNVIKGKLDKVWFKTYRPRNPIKNPVLLSDITRQKKYERKVIKDHFFTYDAVGSTSIEYIQKIADYCEQNNITLYLIWMPATRNYVEGVSDKTKKVFDTLTEELTKRPNVQYLDYSLEYASTEDTKHFIDANHVTYYAAQVLGKKIKNSVLEPKTVKVH